MITRKRQSGQLISAQRDYGATVTAQVFERFSTEVLDFRTIIQKITWIG
ncbi:MAG: hypothetical protein ACRENT_08765 [Thermodesulfobacteriota bacterium]